MLEERLAALEAQNERLVREVAALTQENDALKSRLGQNSSNSSLPPSSDKPWTRPGASSKTSKKKKRHKSGRKPGGQKGHKGTARSLLPPEKVDRVVTAPVSEHCPHCMDSVSKSV